MQRGSMQGLGSSRELARPHGEGGLRRQDELPFPSILLHARGGEGDAGQPWGGVYTPKGITGCWEDGRAAAAQLNHPCVPSAKEVEDVSLETSGRVTP